MRLILKAKLVPAGTEVTKPTGTKKYVLKQTVPIYGEGAKIVTTSENIMFMVADGSINVIRDDDEVAVWFESFKQLEEFLSIRDLTMGSHQ